MDALAEITGSWDDFYILIATASAKLVYVQFVSLYLYADAISQQKYANLRNFVEQTFSNFFFVLLYAVIFLIPNRGEMILGFSHIGAGGTRSTVIFSFC